MTSLYWIAHPDHTDMFTQGYIGVSGNPELRWRQHSQRVCNPHLTHAIKKYGWDALIKKVVLIADEAYCYAMEAKLRAEDAIGWNIVKGGNKPPVVENKGRFQKGSIPVNKGIPLSEETKAKVSASQKIRLAKSNPCKGRKMAEETKAKISATKRGLSYKEKQ